VKRKPKKEVTTWGTLGCPESFQNSASSTLLRDHLKKMADNYRMLNEIWFMGAKRHMLRKRARTKKTATVVKGLSVPAPTWEEKIKEFKRRTRDSYFRFKAMNE